ncbi:hypothetical protein QYE76_016559 [Lolium multiflorum]|uniref:Uncharacterized protein n=1 Tax=Lolium multiflorum TaxID=4521 RepID=A0AAD8QJP1_LOLMU|nr:hypothetical protein QYE76_016559 [Lolium multiflorum]
MASSSSPVPALAAALGPPPTQLLTRENMLVWKALVVPALHGACVLELVEGVEQAPSKLIEAEDAKGNKIKIQNSEYVSWIPRDQQVLRWLVNAISPDVLAHVIGLETSAEAWEAINNHVSASSKSRIQHLRAALVETKKNDLSAEKYFSKMKTIAQELAAAGKPLDDDELVWYVLKNLGGTYKNLITAVRANPNTTLSDLFSQVQAFDRMEKDDDTPSFNSSANVARRGDCCDPLYLWVIKVVHLHVDRTVGKTIAVGRTIVVARIDGVMMIAVAVAVVVVEEIVVATKTVALAVTMVTGLAVSPLAMLTPLAKSVISMGTGKGLLGGAMAMIVVTMESVETMMLMLIWHHMELIPTGNTNANFRQNGEEIDEENAAQNHAEDDETSIEFDADSAGEHSPAVSDPEAESPALGTRGPTVSGAHAPSAAPDAPRRGQSPPLHAARGEHTPSSSPGPPPGASPATPDATPERPYSCRLLRRIPRDPLWPVLLVMILRHPLNKHRRRHPLLMLNHNDHLLHVFKLVSNKVYDNPKNTLMVRCAMDCFLPQVNHLHFLRLLILLNGAKLWRRNIML